MTRLGMWPMAELGQTGDPKQLVPGDPGAIDENVVAIRGRGQAMENAAMV
jgi:hypothetical protein